MKVYITSVPGWDDPIPFTVIRMGTGSYAEGRHYTAVNLNSPSQPRYTNRFDQSLNGSEPETCWAALERLYPGGNYVNVMFPVLLEEVYVIDD